jgi:hypothetical protein
MACSIVIQSGEEGDHAAAIDIASLSASKLKLVGRYREGWRSSMSKGEFVRGKSSA